MVRALLRVPASGRTCCAGAWTASTACRTARYELIDYKTGKPKTAGELREDVQLSLYQMGAREAWGLETSAQSYYYVLENEKVPVEHSEEELERVRGTGRRDRRRDHRARSSSRRPSLELCSFCDYRIVCPAAEK